MDRFSKDYTAALVDDEVKDETLRNQLAAE